MTPSIGRIVLVNISSDPDRPALRPAIVTAVWSDICVNAALVVDGGNDAALVRKLGTSEHDPYWLTSITQALAGELEWLIRQAPEQWHLLQPNWPSDFELLGRAVPGRPS